MINSRCTLIPDFAVILLFELCGLLMFAVSGLKPDNLLDLGVTGQPLYAGQETAAPHCSAQLSPQPGHCHQGQALGTRTGTADQILGVISVY